MLKQAPHLAPAYNNLGMLYFKEHDYPQAAEVLERGLEINPDMPTASALLGMSYHEMGEHEKAEPLLEAAVRANPSDDDLQMALAHNLVDLGQYDAATPYLRSYLERNPKRSAGVVPAGQDLPSASPKTPWAKSTRLIRTQ